MGWSAGMPSSESRHPVVMLRGLSLVAALVLTACSAPAVSSQTASTTAAAQCVAAAGGPAQNVETMESLRRAVETGPLYVALIKQSSVASCRIGTDSAAVTLEYMFGDGSWLQARRDPEIEYNNQEARLAVPPADDPVTILTSTEQFAFAPKGCGIDWRTTETQPAGDDPGATETIYRGDVCNCQARVRRDTTGRVTRLLFRSAC